MTRLPHSELRHLQAASEHRHRQGPGPPGEHRGGEEARGSRSSRQERAVRRVWRAGGLQRSPLRPWQYADLGHTWRASETPSEPVASIGGAGGADPESVHPAGGELTVECTSSAGAAFRSRFALARKHKAGLGRETWCKLRPVSSKFVMRPTLGRRPPPAGIWGCVSIPRPTAFRPPSSSEDRLMYPSEGAVAQGRASGAGIPTSVTSPAAGA